MNKAPCKNCERRIANPNCHATCQEYKDFVTSRKEYLDQKKSGSLIAEYIKLQKKKVNHRG